MNIPLIIAAVLTITIGLIHSVLGERLIVSPLLKRDLPKILGSDFITRQTIRFAWHLTTIAVWALAAIMVVYSSRPLDTTGVAVLTIIAVTFLISSLISLIAVRGKHFSWWFFLLIALAVWFGLKNGANI